MYYSDMSQSSSGKSSEGDRESTGGAGALSRRLAGASQPSTHPTEPRPAPVDWQSDGVQDATGAVPYATLGMLDGTVLARLPCAEELGTVIIGRSTTASIRVHDPFVHRLHADITWDPVTKSHVITHGDGSNGTFVNLQRISQPTRLIDGTRIRVGKTEIIYRRLWYPSS